MNKDERARLLMSLAVSLLNVVQAETAEDELDDGQKDEETLTEIAAGRDKAVDDFFLLFRAVVREAAGF